MNKKWKRKVHLHHCYGDIKRCSIKLSQQRLEVYWLQAEGMGQSFPNGDFIPIILYFIEVVLNVNLIMKVYSVIFLFVSPLPSIYASVYFRFHYLYFICLNTFLHIHYPYTGSGIHMNIWTLCIIIIVYISVLILVSLCNYNGCLCIVFTYKPVNVRGVHVVA